jgi:hypothetical protein
MLFVFDFVLLLLFQELILSDFGAVLLSFEFCLVQHSVDTNNTCSACSVVRVYLFR